MTPTPPSHTTFQDGRYAPRRRQRNTNQYDASQIAHPSLQRPQLLTPLPDPRRGAENEEDMDEQFYEADDAELEDEDEDEDAEDEDGIEDEEHEVDGEEGGIEEVPMEIDPPFDIATLGLKEIGNLASWTVSSCKPGCGVEALRDEDTSLFWQSDGPQPHHLNIHFSRLVSILSIRIYLDFEADESYTPTRITLLAGTGYHDLLPFSALEFAQPKGWIDVPLDHVGGGPDGKTLRAFIVQVKIVENHQNGKDTHVRGLKIYARDERSKKGVGLGEGMGLSERTDDGNANGRGKRMAHLADEKTWIVEPDWMGEPELR